MPAIGIMAATSHECVASNIVVHEIYIAFSFSLTKWLRTNIRVSRAEYGFAVLVERFLARY